jgi:hypothetical protein
MAGRRVCHERAEQFVRRAGDLVNGPVESELVRLGRPGKTTQLADEL